MKNPQIVSPPQKGWLPLVFLIILTIGILIISVISLYLGWTTIFQNLFYFPIIFACVYYVKRGFVFSVLLACGYFVLMAIFSQDPGILGGALMRLLIFILVAGVITYLSIIRLRTEEALGASEVQYRRLFEAAQDGILIVDAESGQIVDANPFLIDMLGFSHEQFLGKKLWEIGHSKDILANKEIFEKLQQQEYIRYEDLPLETFDGHQIAVEFVSNVYVVDHKRVIQCNIRDITERKRAEAELRLKDLVFESSIAAGWIADMRGIITHVNDAFLRMWEYRSKEGAVGGSVASFFAHEPDAGPVLESLNRTGRWEGEFLAKRADGSTFISHGLATTVRDETGHVIGYQSANLDVTSERKIQKSLKESEDRFRISAQSVSDVIWDWDIENGNLDWYGRIDAILGYAPGEFPRTLDAWEKIIHPDDRDQVMAVLDRHVKTQAPYIAEYRVIRKDGSVRYWIDKGTAMRDENGRAYRMGGSCSDITERKLAEEALISSEVRYRRLFEAAQDGILILDADTGKIVDVNPFLTNLLGFSREQFLGKKLWEIGLFKDIVANKDNFEELQRQEYIRYEDLPLETTDGRRIDVEFVSNIYTVDNKKVIQCNIRNITERKLAEEALRQKNEELDGYFTNTLDLLCIADTDGYFRRLNKEWESALGYSIAELEGKRFLDFVHPDDMEATLGAMSELSAGKKVLQFTNRYRHKDGSYRWIEWRSFPAGNLIYASARDVTERKKMTEQIEASLAEKETLLKEIHHRVKNNLQIITSLLNLQIRKLDDSKTIEALRDSQSRVRSMALVHEHLYRGKDFAHIDLGNYIRALGTGLLQSYETGNRGVRFDLKIQDVYVDINTAIPLGLISNELITNSLKYAFKEKNGGKISISATEDPQALTFVVADNGAGMPEHITLENQTSLGLRLVNSLTSQLHGTVTIDRTEGTKFVFTIPKQAEDKGEV